jgi:hypothetical protein
LRIKGFVVGGTTQDQFPIKTHPMETCAAQLWSLKFTLGTNLKGEQYKLIIIHQKCVTIYKSEGVANCDAANR